MVNDFSKYRIILASASPRRRELLSLIVPEFIVHPAAIDEPLVGESPEESVSQISYLKANTLSYEENALVIGADTIVYIDDMPLGKPRDEDDARAMLKRLSGKSHKVFTGVTVINTAAGCSLSKTACTKVYFAEMTDSDIEEYIKTGEPLDKAGAYGIQGHASKYIEGIEGCYFNVVGLPVRLTFELLRQSIENTG